MTVYLAINQFVTKAMLLVSDLLTFAGLAGLMYFMCLGFIGLGTRITARRNKA